MNTRWKVVRIHRELIEPQTTPYRRYRVFGEALAGPFNSTDDARHWINMHRELRGRIAVRPVSTGGRKRSAGQEKPLVA
jgi:hypothetical protein